MKKFKILIGIMVMLIVQSMLCSIAFADPSVSVTKNSVELTSPTLALTGEMSEQKEEKIQSDDNQKSSTTKDISNENYDHSPKTADTFNFIAVIGVLLSGTMIIVQKSRIKTNRY